MADAHHHAVSSARKWGGEPEEYFPIHAWFDASKHHIADARHRALRHHTLGIADAIEKFGDETGCITLSTGRQIPVRWIGEQHMREDFGRIPSFKDWTDEMQLKGWMALGAARLSQELEDVQADPSHDALRPTERLQDERR